MGQSSSSSRGANEQASSAGTSSPVASSSLVASASMLLPQPVWFGNWQLQQQGSHLFVTSKEQGGCACRISLSSPGAILRNSGASGAIDRQGNITAEMEAEFPSLSTRGNLSTLPTSDTMFGEWKVTFDHTLSLFHPNSNYSLVFSPGSNGWMEIKEAPGQPGFCTTVWTSENIPAMQIPCAPPPPRPSSPPAGRRRRLAEGAPSIGRTMQFGEWQIRIAEGDSALYVLSSNHSGNHLRFVPDSNGHWGRQSSSATMIVWSSGGNSSRDYAMPERSTSPDIEPLPSPFQFGTWTFTASGDDGDNDVIISHPENAYTIVISSISNGWFRVVNGAESRTMWTGDGAREASFENLVSGRGDASASDSDGLPSPPRVRRAGRADRAAQQGPPSYEPPADTDETLKLRRLASSADDAPADYCCPITSCVMVHPVLTADGETYEHSAIKQWLESNNRSPLTNQPLRHRRLIPNKVLKRLIVAYLDTLAKPDSSA
eukprot:m.47022 g.47022  ORF g.47022 m.47022 type:complete len:488 (+) comp10949_c0_seq1:280-1743(+)